MKSKFQNQRRSGVCKNSKQRWENIPTVCHLKLKTAMKYKRIRLPDRRKCPYGLGCHRNWAAGVPFVVHGTN
jgi:hypothetical protein